MDKDKKRVIQYLESLPQDSREALGDLRKIINNAIPDAEEGFSYGVPAFKIKGRPVVCYAAFKNHCGFYPMSPEILRRFSSDLANFETGKGTIRFTTEKPLPGELVKRILRERLKEMEK